MQSNTFKHLPNDLMFIKKLEKIITKWSKGKKKKKEKIKQDEEARKQHFLSRLNRNWVEMQS